MKKPAGYQPIKLSDVSSARGAPMGRSALHRTGLTKPQFQLECVPMVDGDYDVGGAYWGGPGPLWCADFTTPLTQTRIVHFFIRAKDREAAMAEVRKTYKDAEFLPEKGSIIKQTIEYLRNYCDQLDSKGDEGDEELMEEAEQEISLLEDELLKIRSE